MDCTFGIRYLLLGFLMLIFQGLPSEVAAQSMGFEASGLPPLKSFSAKEIGASRQSWSILEDDRGILFFGNNEGLLTYDGSSWELIPSPNGNLIRSLAMDEHGVIYYGGRNDLGYVSSDSLGQLKLVSLRDKVPVEDEDFDDLWEIVYLNGQVIFQTYEYIFTLDVGAEKSWEDRSFTVINAPSRIMSSAVIDGTCYVYAKGDGLTQLTNGQLQPLSQEAVIQDAVVDMLPWFPNSNKAQMLLCGLRNGLHVWDGKQMLPFPLEKQAADLMQTAKITNACYLSDGTLALATDNLGLIVLNEAGQLVNHLHKETGFPVEDTNDLLPDFQGGLWVSTSLGIIRVDLPASLTHFSDQSDISYRVYSMTPYNGKLYVATTNGLFVSSINDGQGFEHVPGPNTAIWNLLSTGTDLLAVSPYTGIFQLDNNRLRRISGQVPIKLTLSRFNDKVVYVGDGSTDYGFSILYKTAKGWSRILTKPIILDQIRYLEEEKPGVLWLGSRSKGFLRVEIPYLKDLNDQSFSNLAQLDSLTVNVKRYPDSLSTSAFRARPYFVHGKLYLASSEGLKRMATDGDQLIPDSTLGPILADTSTIINELVAGSNGSIWVNYIEAGRDAASIGKLSPTNDGNYRLEEVIDMLRISDLQFTSMWTSGDIDDPLWFGTTNGLIKYQPQIKRDNKAAFSTLIRSVSIHGDSLLYAGNDLKTGAAFISPVLSYAHNALRFKFSAVNYEVPENTLYQYQLEGFDKNWSDWTSENQKDYTNLPEGSYEFRVRSKNIYGVMGEEGTFEFRVLPPWYRQWWAFLLYIILGVTAITYLILAYNRWKTQQLELRNQQLEQAVDEKTQEILKTQKQLILQEKMASLGQMTAGMAHEMKNPLNFINNFSIGSMELLDEIQDELEEPTNKAGGEEIKGQLSLLKNYIESIHNNGVRMDKIVLGMLNHTSINAGERVATDVKRLADESINLAFYGFKGRHPNFDFEVIKDYENKPLMAQVYPNELSKSLINIFDNACYAIHKKAQSSNEAYQPTIRVTIQPQDGHLCLKVWDNGNGIPEADREKIFTPFYTTKPTGAGNIGLGLSIAFDVIVKGHQGRFYIESEAGNFTSFIIELPTAKNEVEEKESLSEEESQGGQDTH